MQSNSDRIFLAFLFFFYVFAQANAQTDTTVKVPFFQPPIPVEVMVGNHSSMYEVVVGKRILKSRFSFNTFMNFEVDYDELTPDIYYVQNFISYDLTKGFGLGLGGNFQSGNPFKPVAVLSYAYYTDAIGLLVQPSIELHKDNAHELYLLFEWVGSNQAKFQPYAKISAYGSVKDATDYLYHNWRIGLNYKSFRFGPAMNIQYFRDKVTPGQNFFISNNNFGGFVSVLIN